MAIALSPVTASKLQVALVKWLPFFSVLVGIGILFAAYMGLYRDKLGQIMPGGRLDLRPLQERVNEAQQTLVKIDQSLMAYGQLNSEFRMNTAMAMPTDADTTGLILQLDGLTRQSGFAMMSLDVSPEDRATGPKRLVRITMDLRGGDYEQFKVLLANIERSQRLLDVQGLSFSAPGGAYGLTILAYWLDEKAVATDKTPAAAKATTAVKEAAVAE